MATQIKALSVSRSVRERLPAQPAPGRVLAVFTRACLVASEGGDLLTLVLPEVGDGPLNVVVAGQRGGSWRAVPGTPASLGRGRLCLGALEFVLDGARTWEPQPAWPALRAAWPVVQDHLAHVRPVAMRRAPEGSLLALLHATGGPRWATHQEVLHITREAAQALAAGWGGDGRALARGARRLAGLGGGLTPAGDDFLAGLMLYAWLAHPRPGAFCQVAADAAAPETTALSSAFLRAAARGECSAAWHALLSALIDSGPASLGEAISGVMAHGQTSGADMLAGFLRVGV